MDLFLSSPLHRHADVDDLHDDDQGDEAYIDDDLMAKVAALERDAIGDAPKEVSHAPTSTLPELNSSSPDPQAGKNESETSAPKRRGRPKRKSIAQPERGGKNLKSSQQSQGSEGNFGKPCGPLGHHFIDLILTLILILH